MNCPKCGRKITKAICGSCGYDIRSQGLISAFPLTIPSQLTLKKGSAESIKCNTEIVRSRSNARGRATFSNGFRGVPNAGTNNVLMSDRPYNFDANGKFYEDRVFGSKYTRNQISTVTFLDTLASLPHDAWDVSRARDGSVRAWVKPNNKLFDLYIGVAGGVVTPADCAGMFAGYGHMKSIHFNGIFDTTKVTDMRSMFYDCNSLTTLDVSDFDTTRVTNMRWMFRGCSSLTVLDVSGFDTSKVTNMYGMFGSCSSLTALDVSDFDTANVTNMWLMFYGCNSLTALDVSGFSIANVTNMCSMFEDCCSLRSLQIKNWNTSNIVTISMFKHCALPREVVSAILSGRTVST